ncbi:PfkB family carbohydrate kinase [Arsenicicoccus piscis]|uniref:Carbohydrate kinase PfkB domain-containing protein n=1 Tax=Arsenicicoccus piscis TaxID=673954 RepID=A0ABQ6HIQ2_9MICO|nr:hypothetical protein GCM10025862_03820 [Arsenicicoccus piscis]
MVKASDEDVEWLYDNQDLREVMQGWGQHGPSLIVVTRGHRGSTSLVVNTGEIVDLPAGKTVVVDTVGAGDSFMAGLISGLLDAGFLGSTKAREGLRAAHLVDLLPALSRAGGCSAITVARAGANPPTRAELEV